MILAVTLTCPWSEESLQWNPPESTKAPFSHRAEQSVSFFASCNACAHLCYLFVHLQHCRKDMWGLCLQQLLGYLGRGSTAILPPISLCGKMGRIIFVLKSIRSSGKQKRAPSASSLGLLWQKHPCLNHATVGTSELRRMGGQRLFLCFVLFFIYVFLFKWRWKHNLLKWKNVGV